LTPTKYPWRKLGRKILCVLWVKLLTDEVNCATGSPSTRYFRGDY
ncbi:MAG: hypothetical protein ACI9JP_003392, partial [Granulosicoccus sp.]